MSEIGIINRIKSELSALYDKNEVESFVSLLLDKICGLNTTKRLISDKIYLSDEQNGRIDDALERLKRYEPIQYIIGYTDFYGLTLRTDRRALIPRPETEELVDWILHECSTVENVLDICTGSGCIALCLAKYLKEAKVSALDISSEAIGLARENALNHQLDIVFYQKDIMATDSLWQKFDLIVANPPYVTLNERVDMMPNVLDYEPSLALFVDDEDPLIFYRTIARFAQKNLVDGGMLFFEINRKFGKETVDLLASMGFVDIVPKKDISGNDRFIKCRI
ncbi:MAG: peptide chain release factor N(5)-glutamine methyltransferase [Bacteroidetes bacterium]|nr:MAG: peptide chain release factor N(5)-glutamine methyltransferase [Bacteroidota bacterium]